MFELKKPCKDCPFLKDSDMRHSLNEGRLAGIVEDLLSSDYITFSCHKTIDYNNRDENDELIRGPEEQLCFGSMVYMQKIGSPSVTQRIGYATGEIKLSEIKGFMPSVIDPEDI